MSNDTTLFGSEAESAELYRVAIPNKEVRATLSALGFSRQEGVMSLYGERYADRERLLMTIEGAEGKSYIDYPEALSALKAFIETLDDVTICFYEAAQGEIMEEWKINALKELVCNIHESGMLNIGDILGGQGYDHVEVLAILNSLGIESLDDTEEEDDEEDYRE